MSDDNLCNMSIPKLRGYCRKEGIRGYTRITDKEELLRLINDGKKECGICLSDIKINTFVTIPNCSHQVCFDCFVNLVRGSSDCPFCRQSFSETKPNSNVMEKEHLPDEIIDEIANSSMAHGMERYIEGLFSGEETPIEELIQITARRSASMVRQWYMD
jgi:hypothetical protein